MATTAEELVKFGQPAADTRIAGWDPTPKAKLGMLGAEPELSEEESAIVDVLHRFSENEMRPLGQRLDHMEYRRYRRPP